MRRTRIPASSPSTRRSASAAAPAWRLAYSAPQFVEAKGVTQKCDMCAELQAHGEEPACVAICRSVPLKVGDLSELRAEFGDCADVAPLPAC
ncbi:MAG: 4Fe-4S dicluster domain-containing protein [Adlercreutzia equolifaciens]